MKKNQVEKEAPAETSLKAVKTTMKEAYDKAKAAGKLDRPTYRIHTWTEDSALLIGEVKGVSKFVGGKFEAEVNCYRIKTDDGTVSCILGTYTDGQLAEVDLIGKTVCIQFQGQKSLDDGRKVNVFDVDVIGGPTDGKVTDK